MRLFMQVHKNLKSKLIPRGRELAAVKVSGGRLQGEGRHRPRKFACPAPSSRASPTLHGWAQNTAGDMINTWTKLTHDPVSLTRQPGPRAPLSPIPNHRAAEIALTWKNHRPLLLPPHCQKEKRPESRIERNKNRGTRTRRTLGFWLGAVVLHWPHARINCGTYKKDQSLGPTLVDLS